MYMYTYMYTYMYMYMYMYVISVYAYIYIYICVCVYIYIYIYVCVCIYIYIYIYICVCLQWANTFAYYPRDRHTYLRNKGKQKAEILATLPHINQTYGYSTTFCSEQTHLSTIQETQTQISHKKEPPGTMFHMFLCFLKEAVSGSGSLSKCSTPHTSNNCVWHIQRKLWQRGHMRHGEILCASSWQKLRRWVTLQVKPEGTKRATSVNVQLPRLQKDLRTGSISRDIVEASVDPTTFALARNPREPARLWCRAAAHAAHIEGSPHARRTIRRYVGREPRDAPPSP